MTFITNNDALSKDLTFQYILQKNKLLSSYEERSCQNNFKTYLL